jgi:benzoyl-CoA reductase/2-hydroxyglutaryl-CoA dehydratase subunit BcrC/BadD/HgdB
MAKQYKADGVVHYTLQFCSPYAIESYSIEKKLKTAGIPMLRIETDYSQNDVGQIKTRVQAFLEVLKK